MMSQNKIVLLDRDGTIIVNKHYLSEPNQVEFIPGAIQGMKVMQDNGYLLAIISNQSGVGRGFFTENDVKEVNSRLVKLLSENGIKISSVHYCPHGPDDNCDCRKPRPGMLFETIEELSGDPKKVWMVGDNKADIEAGQNAGVNTILVRTGYGTEVEAKGNCKPDFIADDLIEVANLVKKK